jgi:23S rRNA (uridine2552-2'-O)-methyltransferase
LHQDITDTEQFKKQLNDLKISTFDIVVSDIAPNTTGIAGVDHVRSIELSQLVLDVADEFLRPKGTLVMKVFHGEKFADFFRRVQRKYGFVTGVKVSASRDRSKEMYIIAQRKK